MPSQHEDEGFKSAEIQMHKQYSEISIIPNPAVQLFCACISKQFNGWIQNFRNFRVTIHASEISADLNPKMKHKNNKAF